jgi:hypothetical protein
MRTNTFEIYQSLRTFGSRKRLYLETLSKEVLTPLPLLVTLTKWKAMSNRNDNCQQMSMRQRCVAVITARGGHMRY